MSAQPSAVRIPILYVILGVLVMISVVPMYFYSTQVEAINRDRLKTNEMLLQNTVTRSLADDLSQHQQSLRMMLANLSSAIQVASGGDIGTQNIEAPELRALLENFVGSSDELAYATLLNADAKGISAGRIAPDAFLQRELEQRTGDRRQRRRLIGVPVRGADDDPFGRHRGRTRNVQGLANGPPREGTHRARGADPARERDRRRTDPRATRGPAIQCS